MKLVKFNGYGAFSHQVFYINPDHVASIEGEAGGVSCRVYLCGMIEYEVGGEIELVTAALKA